MTVNSMAGNAMSVSMMRLAAAKKINGAADDPAGLSILQKLTAQTNGWDKAADNALDMQSLLNVAEGGMASITEQAQRMRELNVQAANGIYTAEDRAAIYAETAQLAESINDVTNTTNFNTMNVIDGTFTNANTASNPEGDGVTVSISGVSADSVSGAQSNISAADSLIGQASAVRSSIGATYNALGHIVESNRITSENLKAAS